LRPGLVAATALCVLATSSAVAAQGFERGRSGELASERLIGMAEVGLGWIVLPGAEVCGDAGCSRGDSALMLEAWQLFRVGGVFAVGAGVTVGLIPTTDAPREEPEGVERDHTRRYFTVEGTVRYYPYREESLEAWAGITSGLVVVSDHFESREPDQEIEFVGPRGVTIRSEGYTVGLAVGGAYVFAPNWSVGGSFRFANWFLPREPETSPLGDEGSLVGRTSVFGLGATISYRVPL
jgi:hypothetical protein